MNSSLAYQRYLRQKEAYRSRDFETVKKLAQEAREELENKGYVKAEPLFGWIEKEWLIKGISEGVIVKKDDGFYPVATEHEEDIIDGYRGRTPIIKGQKKTLNTSQFTGFIERYEEFRRKKEQQQYTANEEMEGLIASKEEGFHGIW